MDFGVGCQGCDLVSTTEAFFARDDAVPAKAVPAAALHAVKEECLAPTAHMTYAVKTQAEHAIL